jgi:hypothetical protein
MDCDNILRQGIFNYVEINTQRSMSENLYKWLSTATLSEIRSLQGGGLNIGFPINGVPISIGLETSDEDYEQWRSALSSGLSRAFTEKETLQIIEKSVSTEIVEAWRQCIPLNLSGGRTGLIGNMQTAQGAARPIFLVRYLPTSAGDYPPIVSSRGFQLAGATTRYPLADGTEIPMAGVSVLLERQGRQDISLILNTTKGTVTITDPGPPPPTAVPSPPLQTDLRLQLDRDPPYRDDRSFPNAWLYRIWARIVGKRETLNRVAQVTYQRATKVRMCYEGTPPISFVGRLLPDGRPLIPRGCGENDWPPLGELTTADRVTKFKMQLGYDAIHNIERADSSLWGRSKTNWISARVILDNGTVWNYLSENPFPDPTYP